MIKRKGLACDPCCNDWKEKIKYLWQNYREVVKGVKLNGSTSYPDGQGIANMGWLVDEDVDLTDNETFYTLTIYRNSELAALVDMSSYWELTIGED